MDSSYASLVKGRCIRNPSLRTLYAFLSSPDNGPPRTRIVSIDWKSCDSKPLQRDIDPSQLANELGAKSSGDCESQLEQGTGAHDPTRAKPGSHKVLVIEDIDKDTMEELGSRLAIDPMFFAAHVHSSWRGFEAATPKYCELPSQAQQQQNFVTFHYHRALVYPDIEKQDYKLLRQSSIDRKVIVFPSVQGRRLGLAKHCCSILVVQPTKEGEGRLGIVLADPPMAESYLSLRGSQKVTINTTSMPLFGGTEDFSAKASTEQDTQQHVTCHSMLQELLYHWCSTAPFDFSTGNLTLGGLSYRPLRIIGAEWVNYLGLMCFSLRQYDTLLSGGLDSLAQLDKISTALNTISSWPRRVASSKDSLSKELAFIDHYGQAGNPSWDTWALLRKDYDYLIQSVAQHGDQLQAAIPLVSTFLQLAENRRTFAETKNMSRLTVVAMVFVPLGFVSSLFSMNEKFSPGGPLFWVYFAVAVPVFALVMLLVMPILHPKQ
ncbi:hypothetical protein PG990_014213 [Apiospora arundinis]